MLSLLLVSAGIYGLSVVFVGKLSAVPVLDVVNKEQGLLTRIGVAYSAYMHTFSADTLPMSIRLFHAFYICFLPR